MVDTTAPVITLLGDAEEVGFEAGAEYTDAGATAADIVDGDLTDSISVDNPVTLPCPGFTADPYSVSDALENKSTITRKVTVGDTAAPVITLLGDAEDRSPKRVLSTQTWSNCFRHPRWRPDSITLLW